MAEILTYFHNLPSDVEEVVNILTSMNIKQRIENFISAIKSIPEAIVTGIIQFGTLLSNIGHSFYDIMRKGIDLIVDGLRKIWDFLDWVYLKLKAIYEYMYNLIDTFIKQIWDRKIDFVSALKASFIGYASYRAIKKKYASSPLKFAIGVLGVELVQPLIYELNKNFLNSLFSKYKPTYTIDRTGRILSRSLGNMQFNEYELWFDKLNITYVVNPRLFYDEYQRWYDYLQYTLISPSIKSVLDKYKPLDRIEISNISPSVMDLFDKFEPSDKLEYRTISEFSTSFHDVYKPSDQVNVERISYTSVATRVSITQSTIKINEEFKLTSPSLKITQNTVKLNGQISSSASA